MKKYSRKDLLLARILHQTETFMAKALRGEAVVYLPRTSNNAGHGSLRLTRRVKCFQLVFQLLGITNRSLAEPPEFTSNTCMLFSFSQSLKRFHAMFWLGAVAISLILCACTTTQELLMDSDTGQLQLRSIQTRAFDTTDRDMMLRTVMATLQDFGFVLDAGEVGLGTVSGANWKKKKLMRITVSVRPRSESQLLVRANCQIGNELVNDPIPYQRFFMALSKSLFLEAHQVGP